VDHPPHRRGEHPLNADPAAQLTLLDLQAADSALDRISHRRATLPAVATLAELAAEHRQLVERLATAAAEEQRLAAEVEAAEAAVEGVRQHRRRDQVRLDTGQVSSPRELAALQHAIATLADRQETLEEAELVAMEDLEQAQAIQAELAARRSGVEARARETTAQRDAAFAELDEEAAAEAARRAAFAAELPEALLALYERLRAQQGGVGAAALRGNRCEGCRIELNHAELARVRALPPEAVAQCEECRRILVRP
jgi:predicted  nucleic acid-binding Zn-ribbon protein